MNLLVFNCGSSSLTFKVYKYSEGTGLEEILVGKAHRVGVKGDKPSSVEVRYRGETIREEVQLESHRAASVIIIEAVLRLGVAVDRIGHRWANGMDHFTSAVVDRDLLAKLRSLVPLIPIHHSIALAVINECIKRFPSIPQFVTTDNAFHKDLPFRASQYFLPRDLIERRGFRKIGFHGLSFQYVAERAPKILGAAAEDLRLVVCHLGTGGSEIAAIRGGSSADVSMGYTGLPGIVMSTRSGDVDSLLPIYLMWAYGYSVDDVQSILNNKSGLLGLSGKTSDIRDLLARRQVGDEAAGLAVDMYVRGIKKYVGAFIAALEGIDCLVFTDDVGVQCPEIRDLVCTGLEWFGLELDRSLNREPVPGDGGFLEAKRSKVRILALPTDEELVIAEAGVRLLSEAVV